MPRGYWKQMILGQTQLLAAYTPTGLAAENEKRGRHVVNLELAALMKAKGPFFDGIPVAEIREILDRYGFDGAAMEGIYTGRDGRIHEQVGPNSWIVMTWHRMETSGRYEIVVYVS